MTRTFFISSFSICALLFPQPEQSEPSLSQPHAIQHSPFTNEAVAVTKDTNTSETSDPLKFVQRSSPAFVSLPLRFSSTLLSPSSPEPSSHLFVSRETQLKSSRDEWRRLLECLSKREAIKWICTQSRAGEGRWAVYEERK